MVEILTAVAYTAVGGNSRAQAGVVEFLILGLLMLFILQHSIVLAKKSKEAGILLLERVVVERCAARLEFALKELEFTGFGRKIIEVPQRPFASYNLGLEDGKITIKAFFEHIEFNKTVDLDGAKTSCTPGTYANLTFIVERWGNMTEVLC